jgi:hypothetical protein
MSLRNTLLLLLLLFGGGTSIVSTCDCHGLKGEFVSVLPITARQMSNKSDKSFKHVRYHELSLTDALIGNSASILYRLPTRYVCSTDVKINTSVVPSRFR